MFSREEIEAGEGRIDGEKTWAYEYACGEILVTNRKQDIPLSAEIVGYYPANGDPFVWL